MTEPVVTVALPTYRRLEYLPGAIESALAQTFGDFEVVVSDNEMSDEVRTLVESYGDDRVVYRHNGDNIGSLPNTIAACRAGRGRYVAVLHDDDQWDPRFLEKLVAPLEDDPSLAVAFCDHHVMLADGSLDAAQGAMNTRRWRRDRLREGPYRPFMNIALVDRAPQLAAAGLIRRSAIDWDDYPLEIHPMFDTWTAYLACRDGAGAWFCPERLTRYRTHEATLTSTGRWSRQFVWMYSHFLGDRRLQPIHPALRKELARFRLIFATDLLAENDKQHARHEARQGIRDVITVRGVMTLLLASLPGNSAGKVAVARRVSRRIDRRVVRY